MQEHDFPVPPPARVGKTSRVRTMRESAVEKRLTVGVKARAGLCWKFTSPGIRGVPDRLALRPIPPRHRAIVGRYVRFAELKTTRGRLSPNQQARIRELGDLGHVVAVLHGPAEVDTFLEGWDD